MKVKSKKTQKKVNRNQRQINRHLDVGMPKVPLTKFNNRKEPEKLEDWDGAS
ncbi:MAG: hypothetical protein Tsb0014_47040 [Pleurocapsa sp.]